MFWIRQLVAIAALPFTVTVIVPVWIGRQAGTILDLSMLSGRAPLLIAGLVLLGAGLFLFGTSVYEFATRGRGTLAPWDPPRNLVVRGPYRYVRNPMISGVVLILFGEAAVLGSRPHFVWAVLFLGINAIYIPLLEEPLLARRFGSDYAAYCRHVPRLIPRLTPWTPADS